MIPGPAPLPLPLIRNEGTPGHLLIEGHGTGMYHNTTYETGQTLLDFRQAAVRQDAEVLMFYRQHPADTFTPSEIWQQAGFAARDVPLTSIRRAITDLTKKGLLVKTTIKRPGHYSRPEFAWACPRGRATIGGDLYT